MAARGGKRHLQAAPPFGHLTVCGRPVEGRENEIVFRLDGRDPNTCQSCWRMRGQAAPRRRAIHPSGRVER